MGLFARTLNTVKGWLGTAATALERQVALEQAREALREEWQPLQQEMRVLLRLREQLEEALAAAEQRLADVDARLQTQPGNNQLAAEKAEQAAAVSHLQIRLAETDPVAESLKERVLSLKSRIDELNETHSGG